MQPTSILRIQCPDATGLIFRLTKVLADKGLNIVSNFEFVDQDAKQFFMRLEVEASQLEPQLVETLQKELPQPAIVTASCSQVKRLAVLVGKESHCLGDLLVRSAFGELDAEIACVVSNHSTLAELTGKFGIPFHEIPVQKGKREDHEKMVLECLSQYNFDYVVLAKYMRILTPSFVASYADRIINIHHSFLPAFVGAKPYHQAFQRGVKIIGATAHFVNNDLDDGPIIVQNIHRVTHSYTIADLINAGRDVEKATLAQALRLVLDDRVFVAGPRTIVFQ